MTSESMPVRLDELVATVLNTPKLPPHLDPKHLLDEDVVPPRAIARKVYALRKLVRSGGDDEPFAGRVSDSRAVAKYFGTMLRSERTESIWIVGCSARHQIAFHRCVAQGGFAQCSVTIAELVRPLVMNACAAAVMVHNHPSGDPSPSHEDVELTRRFGDACTLLGIRLLDHVIIGRDAHYSFLDAGLPLTSR